ncbi:hypothetical protein LTR85_000472 [Meristemomyces frigidus]|nr:hypothetical protein LTR85_000472 [Meristemomyces frigidus]
MQINVCLGPHEKDSAIFFDAAREYIDYTNAVLLRARDDGSLQEILQHVRDLGQVDPAIARESGDIGLHAFSRRVRAQLQSDLDSKTFFRCHSATQLDQLTEALYAISERSYFERLWVVQELLLARKAIVCCGESLLDFQDLVDFQRDLSVYCSHQKHRQEYGEIDPTTTRGFTSIENVWHGWSGAGMGLLDLTDYFAHFKCFDARDKIYGMLALVDWKDFPPMKPDYTKSALAVGLEAIAYMCPVPGEGRLATPGCDSDDTNWPGWPIVSATQIAEGLGLHSQDPDIQRLLRQRRNPEHATNPPRTPATMPAAVFKARPRVAIKADSFCQLFPHPTVEDALAACLMHREGPLARTVAALAVRPPGFEEQPGPNLEEVSYTAVSASFGPCVKVARWAQPEDFVLSFHVSGFDPGLLVRETESGSGCFQIIGQAIFDVHTVICSGREECHCSFDAARHPSPKSEMNAYFDPEDLLLFVCQSLVPDDVRSLDLTRWREGEAGKKIRESHVSQVGEIGDDDRLLPQRLATSVVQPSDSLSSFVKLGSSERVVKEQSAEAAQSLEQLREFVRQFNKQRNEV